MKHRVLTTVFVFLSFCLAPLSAYASKEPPAITAILDVIERQYKAAGGSRPVYSTIEPDGDGGATLTDVSWTIKKDGVTGAFKIAKTVLSGVTQRANGGYSFKSILTENIAIAMDMPEIGPIILRVPHTSSTNTHLLPTTSPDGIDYSALLGGVVYESSLVPVMMITAGDKSFDAKNFSSKWSGDPETGLGKWNISLESGVVPVSVFPDQQFKKDMKEELGFEEFDLAFDASVAVSEKDKKLDLAFGLRLKGKNIGDFEFAFAGHDFPAKLIKIMKSVEAGAEPNIGQIMPLVIGVKFGRLKLRFVDDNFARKMLAYAAKKEGTTVEELTANGGAILQIGLSQLGSPDFTKAVIAAYNAFIKNPQNISLEASPKQPVPVAELMGMMGNPASAIKTLGLKVEANR